MIPPRPRKGWGDGSDLPGDGRGGGGGGGGGVRLERCNGGDGGRCYREEGTCRCGVGGGAEKGYCCG
jgi:hypothetical protein